MADKSKEDYARLCWLLSDVGTQTLRNVFDRFYSPIHLRDNISRLEVKILVDKLNSQGKITDRQRELLYPSGNRVISSRRFHFDMLIALLHNICHISPPYPNGWNKLPLPDDKSLSADITRIKVAKDLLCRIDSVIEEEFKEIWTSVTEAVLRLDGAEGKRKIYRVQSEILASEYMQEQFIHKLRAKEEVKSENPLPDKTKKLLKQRSSMSPFKDIPPTLNPGEGIGEEDTIVLNKTFKVLIETVSVDDVMGFLQENDVITEEHRDKIQAIHRNSPKMRYLLSVLQTTTNTQAFKLFCEAIKDKYAQVHDTIVKIRHQIYKKGTVNKTDLLGYCKKAVVQQYKRLYENIRPIPWLDYTDKRENFFVPLHTFNSEGEHITLENLFPKTGMVKVLQGPAGCGKTTLCKMMTKNWCNNPESFCTSFDLVLYLDLARVSCNETLIDAIYNQILPDNFKINQANFKSVLETNTKQILFVLDGFVDGGVENEDVERLLKRDLFTGCSVLVLTQPSCARIAKAKVNSYVHTKGLATKNIARCIKTYTSLVEIEEKPLNKFLEALKAQEDTIETLRTPLACMYIILNPDEPLPDFNHLSDFNLILKNFLNHLTETFYTDNDLLTEAGKVLDIAKKMISCLQEMAYKHLLEGRMLITLEEMESFEIESVEKLGLFEAVDGRSWLYQCSIWRDYLAAQYLFGANDYHFEKELNKNQLLHLPQFEQMIQFLCGLEASNEESKKLGIIASAYASHNEKHVKGIAFSPEFLDADDEVVTKRKGQFLNFVRSLSALWASKNNAEMLDIIAKSLPPCINLKCSLLFSETAMMGLSYILNLPTQTVVEVNISLGKLHDYQTHSLLKLARAIGLNQHIKTLRVSWLSINIAAKFLGAVLENNTSIRLVHVERVKGRHKLPTTDTAAMWSGLQAASSNMTNVECFRFINCPYPNVVGHVIRHLPPTLPELDISDCAFDMVCGQHLAYLLERTTKLNSLDISGVKMGNTEFTAFISGIKVCHSLQVMKVSQAKLGREAFLSLCDSLLMAKNIKSLDLSGCHLTTEMGTRLAEIAEQVKSLRTLSLLNSQITDEGRSLIQISSPRSLKVLGIQKSSGLPPIFGGY